MRSARVVDMWPTVFTDPHTHTGPRWRATSIESPPSIQSKATVSLFSRPLTRSDCPAGLEGSGGQRVCWMGEGSFQRIEWKSKGESGEMLSCLWHSYDAPMSEEREPRRQYCVRIPWKDRPQGWQVGNMTGCHRHWKAGRSQRISVVHSFPLLLSGYANDWNSYSDVCSTSNQIWRIVNAFN